ncbi:MAG TPA: hypothetical protein VIF09_20115 [Polyangiaceae bacterium]|jgi:hypothetical protein
MTTTTKNNKPTAKANDAKIMAGIDKNLTAMTTVTLSGKTYTVAQLKAVFQADSDVINATETAHKTLAQAVLNETTSRAATRTVEQALRSFILAYFGSDAVTVLGDFGFTARKSTATKSVATKALASAKTAATRKARNTMGSVQKQGVTGNVTSATLTQTGAGAVITPAPAPGSASSTEITPAAAPQAAPGGNAGATPNAQPSAQAPATPPAQGAKPTS